MLIATANYPEVDIPYQMAHLDALAGGASVRLGEVREPLSSVNSLSEYVFDEVEFQGNREGYYDPRNSWCWTAGFVAIWGLIPLRTHSTFQAAR